MESPEVRSSGPSGSPPAVAVDPAPGTAPAGPPEGPPGDLPTDPPAPRWSVAAVARRVGVAPSTLRTWDRRYALGPSDHTAGAHRRYTAADLARLEAMRRLTHEGLAPAEAARIVLGTPVERLGGPHESRPRSGPGGPGGRVLALPRSDAAARGLGRAAMALDAQTVTATVRAQVERYGVVAAWDHVLRPVLDAAGQRWATTGEGVEVEHLLADCVTVVLREVAGRAKEHRGRRPVLLSCAPGEQHALPLSALAAGLAERGVASRTLGPAMPAEALRAAVRRTVPAVLFVWSQLPATADPAVLEQLPVTRPATTVVVGGPGWQGVRLPARVHVARDLAAAVELAAEPLRT